MVYFIKQYGFLLALVMASFAFAQPKVKDYIIEGNNYYSKGKFDEAEYVYKRAALEDPTSVKANYNLGNALYQQKRFKESISHYNRSAEIAQSKTEKHQAYHNAGNAYLEEKEYAKAVESFKNALRNDPHDESTRYNLAYAKKMLEKQQQKEKKENKKDSKQDQKENKDQQDQQNQQQNKDQQNQNQQNNKNQQDQENQAGKSQRENEGGNPKSGGQNGDQKGQGNQQSPEIKNGSKGDGSEQDNAPVGVGDGMLKALQEQEARTQRRIIQQKAEKQRTKTSKDW